MIKRRYEPPQKQSDDVTISIKPEKLRLYSPAWSEYKLLDAGDGKKLERWGKIITIRPDIQATCKPGWPLNRWQEMAHWQFEELSATQGQWNKLNSQAPEQWEISYESLNFILKLTKFKHVGLFPEQQANWHFIQQRVKAGQKVLNLFAYTGAASLVARVSGAEVVHVDSVKQMLAWAKDNMERSQQSDIKWVLEDALKFAQRELKRGNRYDGIIMDPPAWGLGAKGEKWKLENNLADLIETAYGLMNPGAFLIVNTYTPKVELTDLTQSAQKHFSANQVEVKQLWMQSKTGKELYFGNLLRAVK